MEKIVMLNELKSDLVEHMYPKLRAFFNQITYENYDQYIMAYEYGPYLLYESFNFMPSSFDSTEVLDEFEKRKLLLFLNGVTLYQIKSIDNIAMICDAYDIKHKFER